MPARSPSEPVKVWVSADPDGTVSIATEHGPIENVARCEIVMEPMDLTRVTIEILGTPVHVEGVLAGVTFLCPGCTKPVPHDCKGIE